MRVLVSAFRCDDSGVSEAYVGYRWVCEIAQYAKVQLVTVEKTLNLPENVQLITTGAAFSFHNLYLSSFNRAVKFDYFYFNWNSRRYAKLAREADIVHHVTPIAPRYPSALGCAAQHFVLGPIGGGLRVPESFRAFVERDEPTYYKLRQVDMFRLRYDPMLRSTYRAADIILLAADYMYDIIPEEFHNKTQIMLETGIDCDQYSSMAKTRSCENITRLLYAGRVVPYKGLEYLLRALGTLNPEERDAIRLDVAGTDAGQYAEKCKRLVGELSLTKIVSFHGRVDKFKMRELYKESDIFCLPTLAEASGNVILEAMASGLPVIVVDYGGPAAIVNEQSGILIQPRNPEYLVNGIVCAIRRLVGNPEGRRALGAAARQRIRNEFSWTAKGKKLEVIYNNLLHS